MTQPCRHPYSGLFAVLALLGCLVGCRSVTSPAHDDAEPSARAPLKAVPRRMPNPAAPMPALQGAWLERLDLDAGHVAFVTPPLGAREPRPLIVAVHGAGDRPEWACGGWRLATRAHAFVLCPQGNRVRDDRYGWSSSAAILKAIERALPALQQRYGAHIADVPAMYAGFSQGAILAGAVLTAVPGRFPIAIFAEGGYDLISDPGFARAYRAAGGERVCIVCGGPSCFARARRAQPILEAAQLQVVVAGDPLAGHNLNQRMQSALQASWPSLVANQPGWQGLER